MKTIAYSEVPQTHTYVHLAYISASSGPGEAVLPAAVLGAVSFLLMYLVAATTKLNVKFPNAWRLLTLAVVTALGCLVLFGVLSLSSPALGGH
jgi:hypothetical protein